jgi:septal ring factor EnvC (AmiA/AmiB activator)
MVATTALVIGLMALCLAAYAVRRARTLETTLMAKQKADFDHLVERLDTATNNIAAKLRDLEQKVLAGGGLSAELEAEVHAEFERLAAQLEAIGASGEDPIPGDDEDDDGDDNGDDDEPA